MSTILDQLILDVAEQIPKFNDYMLRGFIKKQINSSPEFIDTVYKEAVKLVNGAVTYHDYEILSPADRINFELSMSNPNKLKLQTAVSELQLVRFRFSHEGRFYYTHFYTPYLHNDMLFINGRRYGLIKSVTDQIFSRSKHSGLQVRPIRALLGFNRNNQFRLVSEQRGVISSEFIITARLYHKEKQSKRSCEFTVLHYLLCKFGFVNTMLQFGLLVDDLTFVDHVRPMDNTEYDYFIAKQTNRKTVTDVYLRVRRSVLQHQVIRKVIANLLYLLTHFNFHTVESLYQPDGHDFRVMLGRILNATGSHVETKAKSDADNHIITVDHFIDPITKARFHTFGLMVDDIYQLLHYIFVEIDNFLVNTLPQNLYKKRIDVIDSTLVVAFATTIFKAFYKCHAKTKLQQREVKQLFYQRPMAITEIYSSRRKTQSRNVNPAPEIYGDNWLVSSGIFKLRPGGTPQERFDPSMPLVESIVAFSGSTPGLTGLINPYLPINEQGGVERPDYAEDIEEIVNYLPSR